MRAAILGMAILAAAAAPAQAVEDYEACAALVSADAETALVEAERWERFGGGAPAGHCRALALLAIGSDLAAAEALFDTVRTYPELAPPAQADLLAQAGRIYLDRGMHEQSAYALNLAAQVGPESPAMLRTRAALKLAQGAFETAERDLDALIRVEPGRPGDLVARAIARRNRGDFAGARADALQAAELAPAEPSVFLELGAAERGIGNRDAARQAWLRAIDLDPDRAEGPVGRAAQLSLQRMETGAEE